MGKVSWSAELQEPLGFFDGRFYDRPARSEAGGKFGVKADLELTRGDTAVFGGLKYALGNQVSPP